MSGQLRSVSMLFGAAVLAAQSGFAATWPPTSDAAVGEPAAAVAVGPDLAADKLRLLAAALGAGTPRLQRRDTGTGFGLELEASGAPAESSANPTAAGGAPANQRASHRLPFLGEKAREAGYELPLPFGAGATFYYLSRDIDIEKVRLGRNGEPLATVGDFVDLGSATRVVNVNAKVDAWLLPFLNVYAIVGYIDNKSDTSIEVALPPLLPGGPTRLRSVTVPTALKGSVGGIGITLAGGYRSFFFAADTNVARADLGFDDTFRAVVTSLRAGWNGKVAAKPTRLWINATHWDTFATAKGSVADPDGGTLRFEVDQGPKYPYTYGAGFQVSVTPRFDFAADTGTDFHGGWYVALVPVFRF